MTSNHSNVIVETEKKNRVNKITTLNLIHLEMKGTKVQNLTAVSKLFINPMPAQAKL